MSAFVSIEAEQSVLGALLVDNSAWNRVGDMLTATDFARQEHQAVFTAISALISAMKPADVVTVFERLQVQNKAADVGGLPYLNALAQCVPNAANSRRYAEIVRERSVLRDVVSKLDSAGQIAANDLPLGSKLDAIAALFQGIDESNAARKPMMMDSVMVRVIDGLNAAAEGLPPGWPTGIPGLDSRLNGGLRPGKLYLIAARPGVGKSSLSMQILAHLARADLPVLALNQEMEVEEIGQRALANAARVDYSSIQTGRLDDEGWGRTAEGVDQLSGLPMWIDDEPALTLQAINSKARHVRGLKVLLVDYLQLCEGSGDNRTQAVGSISRGLKKLAKQLGIAVIALSQLNRSVESRQDKRPQMSDLRDSGEVEQDADVIALLWPLADDEGQEVRAIGFDLAKNRLGRRGTFAMNFVGATQRWGESVESIESFRPKRRHKDEDFQ